jgi:SAM-dependent methyltransferase
LPIAGTRFADVSPVALKELAAHGGLPVLANATALPFASQGLDVVVACEILEHLADDVASFHEIGRVLRPDGVFFLSVPLQPALWTEHDVLAGHFRRYEPAALAAQLTAAGFSVTAFCPGVAGGYTLFKSMGAWMFRRFPASAMWMEDHIIMPLAARAKGSVQQTLPAIPPDSLAPSAFIACRRTG